MLVASWFERKQSPLGDPRGWFGPLGLALGRRGVPEAPAWGSSPGQPRFRLSAVSSLLTCGETYLTIGAMSSNESMNLPSSASQTVSDIAAAVESVESSLKGLHVDSLFGADSTKFKELARKD